MPTVEAVTAPTDNPALAEDLGVLKELLERGQVERARVFVQDLVERWPESAAVRQFAHVLEPPVARVVPHRGRRTLDEERAWLRDHAAEYQGCWLAVYRSELIAADRELADVMTKLRKHAHGKEALLHFQADSMVRK